MVYINKVTRAVIDSPTPISGGDWVLREQEKREEPAVTTETATNTDEETEAEVTEKDIDGLTKADIMQELDAFGIEYNKKATKAELYELMMNRK
ncbi:hypothetical protein [Peptoniphilus asaccharolyticus]